MTISVKQLESQVKQRRGNTAKHCVESISSYVHTDWEEFEKKNEDSVWKRNKCFQSTLRNVRTQQSSAILDLRLSNTRSGKSHDYWNGIVFQKLRFQNVLWPHENDKPPYSNSAGLQGAFCGR